MSTQTCLKWVFVAAAIIFTGLIARIAMRAYRRASLWRNFRPTVSRNASSSATSTCRCALPGRKFSEEYFDLYQRYIEQRHADGDMYPPSRDQFATFLVRDLPFSRFYEFRLEGRLVAVAVTDLLPNGLSAVYTFYEPAEERRSLGRYAILWQIAEAQRLGLEAVYLGYWIKNCKKMSYKTQYRPIELLINQRWVILN